MRMFRKYLILAVMLCLLVPWVASADETMSDEATLGNRDSSDHYRWRVNSSGHLLPGTTGTYNIGGTSNYVNDINASGNLTFQTYLLATGMGSGNATSLPTTAANAQTPLYRVAKVFITTRTLTFANGYPGQILTYFSVLCRFINGGKINDRRSYGSN